MNALAEEAFIATAGDPTEGIPKYQTWLNKKSGVGRQVGVCLLS